MLLLVPSDPLSPRRPDPHFSGEAAAARAAGCEVSLIDHDAVQRSDADQAAAAEAVRRVPADGDVVYRGWMLTADQYERFASALVERGALLRTSAAQYRAAHELPGWYQKLTGSTPMSVWTVGDDVSGIPECCRLLTDHQYRSAVLRDYTKSMKHYWAEAAFIPDLFDPDAVLAVARRFRELRDDAFDGGYVLRAFEEFTGAEVRSWWRNGRCVLLTAHPDTPKAQPSVPLQFVDELAPTIGSLGLPFVTADLVERADGRWRVVEVGDGQVSDRPGSCEPTELVAMLTRTQSSP